MSEPGPCSGPHPGDDTHPGAQPEPGDLVAAICRQVPEFVPAYDHLVDLCGDDPGEPMILMELSRFLLSRLVAVESARSVLQRTLAAIEDHLGQIPDDDVGWELIAFAFFDSFSPDERELFDPHIGPRARLLVDGLDLSDQGRGLFW
jgi:hypothetical protein